MTPARSLGAAPRHWARNSPGALVLAAVSLMPFARSHGLSLDFYHGSMFYSREQNFDAMGSGPEYSENFQLFIRNPGPTGLSFHSDLGVHDGIAGATTKAELHSMHVDWQDLAPGVDVSAGRRLVHDFAEPACYIDGVGISYDAGNRAAVSSHAGFTAPSRHADLLVDAGTQAFAAALRADLRLHEMLILGMGIATGEGSDGGRQYRLSTHFVSRVGRVLSLRGYGRYALVRQSLEHAFLQTRVTPGRSTNIDLRFSRQAPLIDSLNYYETLILTRHSELSAALGLLPSKRVRARCGYAVRVFDRGGVDHHSRISVFVNGIGLRLAAAGGVNGTTLEAAPQLTWDHGQTFRAGTSLRYRRYRTTAMESWHNAMVAVGFVRWFVPWPAPSVNLLVEPRVEYLVNDYYTQDLRLMIHTQFQYHRFWKSDSERDTPGSDYGSTEQE